MEIEDDDISIGDGDDIDEEKTGDGPRMITNTEDEGEGFEIPPLNFRPGIRYHISLTANKGLAPRFVMRDMYFQEDIDQPAYPRFKIYIGNRVVTDDDFLNTIIIAISKSKRKSRRQVAWAKLEYRGPGISWDEEYPFPTLRIV